MQQIAWKTVRLQQEHSLMGQQSNYRRGRHQQWKKPSILIKSVLPETQICKKIWLYCIFFPLSFLEVYVIPTAVNSALLWWAEWICCHLKNQKGKFSCAVQIYVAHLTFFALNSKTGKATEIFCTGYRKASEPYHFSLSAQRNGVDYCT